MFTWYSYAVFVIVLIISVVVSFNLGAASIPAAVFYDLQSIETLVGSGIFVDANANGMIDKADLAGDFQTFTPVSSIPVGFTPNGFTDYADTAGISVNTGDQMGLFSRKCIIEDTGTKGTSDTYVGFFKIDLRDRGTFNTLCDDGTYIVYSYKSASMTPQASYSASPNNFVQMSTGNWLDAGGTALTGKNGDATATSFVSWNAGTGAAALRLYDDSAGAETTNYELTVEDRVTTLSFLVVFCD